MSSGTLVWATLEFSRACMCGVGCDVALRLFTNLSLEVGLGVLIVGVAGVCCEPKDWCGVVAILWHSLQT
jgi:hypothetical protein